MVDLVQLKGLRELQNTLLTIDAKVAQKIARAGLRVMLREVQKEMQQRAPKKSGRLRGYIRYKIKQRRDKRGYFGTVGVKGKTLRQRNATSGKMETKLNKDYPYYAYFIEYGAGPHEIPAKTKKPHQKRPVLTIKGGLYSHANHPGVKPKPFLRPAFEASKMRAVQKAGPTMWQELRAVNWRIG